MGLLMLLFLSSCANRALQTSSGMASDAQQDYIYLLENLNDGKLAIWRDSRGTEHHFAVFSTYPQKNKLCRDYFNTIINGSVESEKDFGTSCRVGVNQWQYIQGSDQTSKAHYMQFMRLEKGFKSDYGKQPLEHKHSRPAPNRGSSSKKGIAYPARYTLSPFLLNKSTAAESKYQIPLRRLIDDASRPQDLHPCLIHAIVFYESGYNPNAASPCCAGLMQLGKAAAKEVRVANRKDPRQNLNGGAYYLKKKLNERGINNNISLALASYNCGYGVIKKNNFKIPQRCWSNNPQQYVAKILSKFQQCN